MNGYDVDQYGVPKAPRSILGRKLPAAANSMDQRSRLLIYVSDGLITVAGMALVLLICSLLGNPVPGWSSLLPLFCAVWAGMILAGVMIGEPKVRNHRRDLAEYLTHVHHTEEPGQEEKEK